MIWRPDGDSSPYGALTNFQSINTGYFVSDFGVFVSEFHGMVQLANAVGVPIAASPSPIYLKPVGQSGFDPTYRDADPTQDQAHHFAAFFQFGYYAGAQAGNLAAFLWDLFPNNPGDRELGRVAASIGARFRAGEAGEITMFGVADEISKLCKQ